MLVVHFSFARDNLVMNVTIRKPKGRKTGGFITRGIINTSSMPLSSPGAYFTEFVSLLASLCGVDEQNYALKIYSLFATFHKRF